MLSSMTLAEIQAKYSGIHTPEEINQFHQNMTNSKKWKIVTAGPGHGVALD